MTINVRFTLWIVGLGWRSFEGEEANRGYRNTKEGKCNDSTVRFPYNVNDAGDDRLRSKLSSPMLSAD